MNIRPHDTLSNLKNWPAYDYKDYRLNKDEANNCIAALENYIWHDVKKEGMPKEDGNYLFKLVSPDPAEIAPYTINRETDYIFIVSHVTKGDLGICAALQQHTISWRKIIDYDLEE